MTDDYTELQRRALIHGINASQSRAALRRALSGET